MARIRSIKPEFWSDEKIARVGVSCAAFFIGLWNFCDDEGKCEDSPAQLALRMPVFRREDISRWIATLKKEGLLQSGSLVASEWLVSGSPVAWLRVTNWSHQRIDRPKVAKIQMSDIAWVSENDSSMNREQSSNVRRKDRIGEEKNGSDRIPLRGKTKHDTNDARPKKKTITKELQLSGVEVWQSYLEAYRIRYGVEPVRSAKVNSACKQIVSRIGQADAVQVVKFFVSHNDSFYVRQTHSISLCLRDCESLRTQWLKGKAITQNDVRNFEKTTKTRELLDSIDRDGI